MNRLYGLAAILLLFSSPAAAGDVPRLNLETADSAATSFQAVGLNADADLPNAFLWFSFPPNGYEAVFLRAVRAVIGVRTGQASDKDLDLIADDIRLGSAKLAILLDHPRELGRHLIECCRAPLHNRSAAEIIAGAREAQAQALSAANHMIDEAMADLGGPKASLFDKITVDRVYIRPNAGVFDDAIFHFRIANRADQAIARIYFEVIYQSPGRALPWGTGRYSHDFKGGLEPGERQSLSLEPTWDPSWRNIPFQASDDGVATITLLSITLADGREIFPDKEITDPRTELEAIRGRLPELLNAFSAQKLRL